MLSLSPVLGRLQWEIWILTDSGFACPLQDCGLFESREGAGFTAAAVRIWFHEAVWCGSVLDRLSPDGCEQLEFTRRGMRALGHDPASARVEIRREMATTDWTGKVLDDGSRFDRLHTDPADPDGDGDHDDADDDTRTPVIAPGLAYENADNVED